MGEAIEPLPAQRRIIGLTGGIATGKSTVSDYLASRYGLPVLDADVYAREAVAKGSVGLGAIAHRYGPDILLPDGKLNRPRLGQIIFNDSAEKKWLEQQTHPFIRARFKEVSDTFPPNQTLVYSIPLLFESNLTHLVTEIWVVTCEATQQKQRLIARNHLSPEDAQSRINSQMALKEKCEQADYVLDNSANKDNLYFLIDNFLKM